MNFVDKGGTTKMYIPVHPWISRTFVKIHSADLGFRGLLQKFIPQTSDFADFCKNSFHGLRILQTFIKFIPRTSDFADFFSGPRGLRNSPGRNLCIYSVSEQFLNMKKCKLFECLL